MGASNCACNRDAGGVATDGVGGALVAPAPYREIERPGFDVHARVICSCQHPTALGAADQGFCGPHGEAYTTAGASKTLGNHTEKGGQLVREGAEDTQDTDGTWGRTSKWSNFGLEGPGDLLCRSPSAADRGSGGLDFCDLQISVDSGNREINGLRLAATPVKEDTCVKVSTLDDDSEEVDNSGSDSSDIETEVEPKPMARSRKGGVCAEPVEKGVFEPAVIWKDLSTRLHLADALHGCPLFNSLTSEEVDTVIDTIVIETIEPGRRIVRQGDIGDALYIVLEGVVDCCREDGLDKAANLRRVGTLTNVCMASSRTFSHKSDQGGPKGVQFIQERDAGSVFGELSIMWNTPRTLSVFARDRCKLGRLERKVYKNLVVRRQIRLRERRKEILRSVKLLEMLAEEQLAQLSDALVVKAFEAGEEIIKQNDPGKEFFIVQSGECKACVTTGSDDVQEHRRYFAGDLFGELALLKNAPRAASIIAVDRVEVLMLSRHRFERMLGPLNLLQANLYLFDPRKLIADFYKPGDQRGPQGSLQNLAGPTTSVTSLSQKGEGTQWFAVFRPTSRDAIAKMLGGIAVGKGLNVKGKSARRGRLSGFVPFVQISDNAHKKEIEKFPEDSRVAVYYKSKVAREHALQSMNAVISHLIKKATFSEPILIDKYAPKVYGLDLPGPIIHEVYIMMPDLSPVVDWDTDRKSEPHYMDMNIHTLCSNTEPIVVLVQHDEGDPMNPRGLLIAYAEKYVRPVVSDFDAFLVGSRHMLYEQLPVEQAQLVQWTLQGCEGILKKTKTGAGSSWTSHWLAFLRSETEKGFSVTQPKYGFGDPTSTRLIEDVVTQTAPCGAVRHGAECFNFYFPQELDDIYLVIWEGFVSKPWDYKTEEELRAFLAEKVEEGYCFPLNPVWMVRDAGWYDIIQLMRKRPQNKHNIDSWFPGKFGILQTVDRLRKEYAKGFQQEVDAPGSATLQGYATREDLREDHELLQDAINGVSQIGKWVVTELIDAARLFDDATKEITRPILRAGRSTRATGGGKERRPCRCCGRWYDAKDDAFDDNSAEEGAPPEEIREDLGGRPSRRTPSL